VPDPSDPHRDLAGVLHDVSNALTVLLGWVGEARSPAATPEAVAYALTIIEQRARIARDLTRHAIGSPRFDEQREVSPIVQEVVQTLAVEAHKAGARIVVRGADASARLSGSLDVSQVLTNLVLNALAHAPPGSEVEVSVELTEDKCVVAVTDQGPGVPQDLREGVFRGASLRPGGAGVGLRHSRELARAWGGDVVLADRAESPGGAGARFRIVWPRADVMPRPPTSSLRVQDLAGQKLLIVEDDAAVTQILETVLAARGAAVTIATKLGELTAALRSAPYDAVLVDLSPMGSDPAAEIAKIRASSPDAQIVLVTGNADALPDTIDTSKLHLVRKPFEMSEVLAVLRR
jgi:CheY-like chemotaxis protein/anti-sigma regulatory factor (Ser/Thr protein kinase)